MYSSISLFSIWYQFLLFTQTLCFLLCTFQWHLKRYIYLAPPSYRWRWHVVCWQDKNTGCGWWVMRAAGALQGLPAFLELSGLWGYSAVRPLWLTDWAAVSATDPANRLHQRHIKTSHWTLSAQARTGTLEENYSGQKTFESVNSWRSHFIACNFNFTA